MTRAWNERFVVFGLATLLVSCRAYEPNLLRPPDTGDAGVDPHDATIDASKHDATADDATAGDATTGDAAVVTCAELWGDCNRDAADGCETPLGTFENCSACGVSCASANAVATCEAGACRVVTCASGWEDCDGDGASCETQLGTLENCSGCGARCVIASAFASCATGACKVVMCVPGWADCDRDGTSCETQLGTLENCSGCGSTCELANALASCDRELQCAVAACQPSYANCDGASANGCEVDKRSDATHCGQCGNDCAAHANVASATCSNSSCSYTCSQGFDNCNAAAGCETPLNTSSDCGACDVPCATSCASGSCAPKFGWTKRITIDGTQVLAALPNFPVLVRHTDPDLQGRAATDGSDIYFVAADQTTQLDHEIEAYDPVSGALVAWVRVPNLLMTTDTELYLRYGDGGADRSNAGGVWGPNFKSVWHLGQDPGPGGAQDIKDSTGAAHATALDNMDTADSVSAVVGRGIDFDGIDDELSFTNTFVGSGGHTITAWVNQRATGAADIVISFGGSVTNQGRYLYSAAGASSSLGAGFYFNDLYSTESIENLGWRYVAWTWGGVNTVLYVDGVARYGPTAHSGANTVGTLGKIGAGYWEPRNLNAQLDELRVAVVARSQPWIRTEYNNQRPGSTFIKSVGAEQPVPE